ncbi:hypothetical protein HNY73_015982 [Argiope bruennichi]|uniref:Uncharacterized protein n=1 Tax=Argiope bruennichi TaxID=94029 RepID=A0A8T0EIG1_ARGBR|nr:hypothetical protein HNY73_015982 [Argiope bruennichi]
MMRAQEHGGRKPWGREKERISPWGKAAHGPYSNSRATLATGGLKPVGYMMGALVPLKERSERMYSVTKRTQPTTTIGDASGSCGYDGARCRWVASRADETGLRAWRKGAADKPEGNGWHPAQPMRHIRPTKKGHNALPRLVCSSYRRTSQPDNRKKRRKEPGGHLQEVHTRGYTRIVKRAVVGIKKKWGKAKNTEGANYKRKVEEDYGKEA